MDVQSVSGKIVCCEMSEDISVDTEDDQIDCIVSRLDHTS